MNREKWIYTHNSLGAAVYISKETGEPYDAEGYDYNGYDRQGYDRQGYDFNRIW